MTADDYQHLRESADAAARLHVYRVSYRRADNLARIYRITVRARNADEARAYAKLRDPKFGSTVTSPRKGREVLPPESADGITQAKYRDELLEGTAHFDRVTTDWHGHSIDIEVID